MNLTVTCISITVYLLLIYLSMLFTTHRYSDNVLLIICMNTAVNTKNTVFLKPYLSYDTRLSVNIY